MFTRRPHPLLALAAPCLAGFLAGSAFQSEDETPALPDGVAATIDGAAIGVDEYKDFLLEIVKLERSPAERTEELEQLRALENGYRIRAAEIEGWTSVPVDVPEDVAVVEAALALTHSPESAGFGVREDEAGDFALLRTIPELAPRAVDHDRRPDR